MVFFLPKKTGQHLWWAVYDYEPDTTFDPRFPPRIQRGKKKKEKEIYHQKARLWIFQGKKYKGLFC